MNLHLRWLAVAFLFTATAFAAAPTRDQMVLSDRDDVLGGGKWIYNDLTQGLADARSSGKPLLVVLRCVPCVACAVFDGEVLRFDAELQKLMERFVRIDDVTRARRGRVGQAEQFVADLGAIESNVPGQVRPPSPRADLPGRSALRLQPSAGPRRIELLQLGSAANGVYWVRVSQAGRTVTARIAHVR